IRLGEPRLAELWNRLNSATSSRPMMIQSARFLPKLFTVHAFPYPSRVLKKEEKVAWTERPADLARRRPHLTCKKRFCLNNCKTRSRQRPPRPEQQAPRRRSSELARA